MVIIIAIELAIYSIKSSVKVFQIFTVNLEKYNFDTAGITRFVLVFASMTFLFFVNKVTEIKEEKEEEARKN